MLGRVHPYMWYLSESQQAAVIIINAGENVLFKAAGEEKWLLVVPLQLLLIWLNTARVRLLSVFRSTIIYIASNWIHFRPKLAVQSVFRSLHFMTVFPCNFGALFQTKGSVFITNYTKNSTLFSCALWTTVGPKLPVIKKKEINYIKKGKLIIINIINNNNNNNNDRVFLFWFF